MNRNKGNKELKIHAIPCGMGKNGKECRMSCICWCHFK